MASSLKQSLLSNPGSHLDANHGYAEAGQSSIQISQYGFQTVPVLPAVRALPLRASVLLFAVCRLLALMAALILWCVTVMIASIGRKLSYNGGGGSSCLKDDYFLLPDTCVKWIAKQPFDGPALDWAVTFSALTLGITVLSIFSLDIRSIISDREFLRLMFKGWPPGQAVFLSYCWGFDASKNESPPESTKIVRAIGEMLPCAYIDVRCFCSGDPLKSEMTRAIESSAFSIVFLTPQYLKSINCKHEMEEILRLKSSHECAFFVPESCAAELSASSEVRSLIASGFNVFLLPNRYAQSGMRLLLTKFVMKLFAFVLGEEWNFDISPAVVTEMLIVCGATKCLACGPSGRSPSITEHWEGCARCMFAASENSRSIMQRLPRMLFTSFSLELISLGFMFIAWITQLVMWGKSDSIFFFLTSASAACLLLISMFTCVFIWEYNPFPTNWPVIPIIFQQKLAFRHELWLLCVLRKLDCVFRPPAIFFDDEFRCFQDELNFLCECVQSCSLLASPNFSVNPNAAPCINVVGISTVLRNFDMYFTLSNDASMPLQNTIIFSTTPYSQIFAMQQFQSLKNSDPSFEQNFKAFGQKVLIDCTMAESDGFKLPTLLALVIRCGLSLPKSGLTPGSLAKSFNLGGDPVSNILAFVVTRWLSYLYIFFVVISTMIIMRWPCLLRS